MSQEISQYDEMQARFAGAYEYHKTTYMLKNPPPAEPKAEAIDWKIIIGLLLMCVFAIIVSGTRTVPAFGGGVEGHAAWGMLEVGAVIGSYVLTKKFYNEKRHNRVKWLLEIGSGVAVVVMLAANTLQETRFYGIEIEPGVRLAIVLALSWSAPLLVVVGGTALGAEIVTAEHRDGKAQKEWKIAMDVWRDGLNRSWDSRKAGLGVEIRVERPPSVQLSSGQNGHGRTFGRESKATLLVREHLTLYPSDLSMTVRELADKLQVGKSTVANVMREFK